MVSGALSDNVRGRLVLLNLERDGHIENVTGNDLGGIETFAVLGKLDVDFSPNVNVLFSLDYSDRQHGFSPQINHTPLLPNDLRACALGATSAADCVPGSSNRDAAIARGKAIIADPFKVAVSRTGDENENITTGLSADLTYDVSETLRFKSITSYREFTDENHPDVDGTPADGDNLSFAIVNVSTSLDDTSANEPARQVDTDYFTQEFRFEGTEEKYDWTAGAFFQSYSEGIVNSLPLLARDNLSPLLLNGRALGGTGFLGLPDRENLTNAGDEYVFSADYGDSSYDTDTMALFGEFTYRFSDRLDGFAGLRFTSEEIDVTLKNETTGNKIFTDAQVSAAFENGVLHLDRLINPDATTLVGPEGPIAGTEAITRAAPTRYPGYSLANQGQRNDNSVGSASTDEDFTSYRLGLNYALSDSSSLYTSISRGHVGPAVDMSVGATIDSDELFLAPTKTDAFEVGVKSDLLNDRMRLNAAVFVNEVTDLQTSIINPGTVSTRIVSAGDLDITGFEADLTFAATDNLTLVAGLVLLDHELDGITLACYTGQTEAQGCDLSGGNVNMDDMTDWQDGEQDISGSPSTNTPDTSINLAASYVMPMANRPYDFFATANYSYRSEVQFSLNQDPLASQDGYGLLDLTVGVTDKDGKYEFQLYGKNVTDEFYVSDAFDGSAALGRRVIRTPRGAQAYYGARLKVYF